MNAIQIPPGTPQGAPPLSTPRSSLSTAFLAHIHTASQQASLIAQQQKQLEDLHKQLLTYFKRDSQRAGQRDSQRDDQLANVEVREKRETWDEANVVLDTKLSAVKKQQELKKTMERNAEFADKLAESRHENERLQVSTNTMLPIHYQSTMHTP